MLAPLGRLDRLCFKLARGRMGDNPFPEELLARGRECVACAIGVAEEDMSKMRSRAEAQPFYLGFLCSEQRRRRPWRGGCWWTRW